MASRERGDQLCGPRALAPALDVIERLRSSGGEVQLLTMALNRLASGPELDVAWTSDSVKIWPAVEICLQAGSAPDLVKKLLRHTRPNFVAEPVVNGLLFAGDYPRSVA